MKEETGDGASRAPRRACGRSRQILPGDATARLNQHGMEETDSEVASKLARDTFATSFFLAYLPVLEMEGVRLENL
jgi:hypothetical protein